MHLFQRLCGGGAALALAAALAAAPLSPVSADTDAGNTIVTVQVDTAITLTALTSSFALTGIPGETPTTGATPVTMTVTTNNLAGYNVTVQAAAANLVGALAPTNTDVIPVSSLQVDGPVQGGTYASISNTTPLVVATKPAASAVGGDEIDNNYRITIPFVEPDSYTGTLNYIATTL
ncbi:hypothetical protein [Actinocorallia longicatena]|uniref:Uncharacterized protein n=1 Tax=Actinocorallia longicatena TaxID=111803 RepID=A0ABP6Q1J5_9ACTN